MLHRVKYVCVRGISFFTKLRRCVYVCVCVKLTASRVQSGSCWVEGFLADCVLYVEDKWGQISAKVNFTVQQQQRHENAVQSSEVSPAGHESSANGKTSQQEVRKLETCQTIVDFTIIWTQVFLWIQTSTRPHVVVFQITAMVFLQHYRSHFSATTVQSGKS